MILSSAGSSSSPSSSVRSISILGSTGSIGTTCLSLLEGLDTPFTLQALTAGNNVKKLIDQARRFQPRMVAIHNSAHYAELKQALADLPIIVAAGAEAVADAASLPADWTLAAIVGAAGLLPTMRAIEQGKTVALANKETLVCAGSLMMETVATHQTHLLPVDSEHSAIFQCLNLHHHAAVSKLILTASGGPFLRHDLARLPSVTPKEAITHPNWNMGAKISVDSATMMNKALEVIEAHHLFAMPKEKISVLIHPESIIHSMVAYKDGAIIAQMGIPDMTTPIAVALAYPDRYEVQNTELDVATLTTLHFEPLDEVRFPLVPLSFEVLNDASASIAFNAANEVAVQAFLDQHIAFTDITRVIEAVIASHRKTAIMSLEDAIAQDQLSRIRATEQLALTTQAA